MQGEEKPRTPEYDGYSGFIIVRLVEGSSLEKTDNLRKIAKSRFPGLASFLDRHKEIATRRVIRSVDPEELLEMERKASFSEFAPPHSLTRYWRLDCRKLENSLEEILRAVRNLSDVDLAYAERVVTDPTVNPGDDPLNMFQGYLDPAPDGIDARWAWTQADGEGAGIGFVDLEQGWFLDHEDLIAKTPTLIFNANRNGVGGYRGDHGTAVLGEVVATDNCLGIVGVAPGVTSVRVTSHFDGVDPFHVAEAITEATRVMSSGDVLLLEVERARLPTETDPCDFIAIRTAVGSGIIVIEAAGNRGFDLDTWVGPDGRRLDRTSANDSGAIIVGACQSIGRSRHLESNYGSNRLDCFAWGDSIATLGYRDLSPVGTPDNMLYTLQFDKTSGAAPIIAGAALIVQGKYQAAHGGARLFPSQMRTLLSDPGTGTPQGEPVAEFIGIMPDLHAIIESRLGLSPDLYMRDFVGDTGVVPSIGAISASPDIIVRPARESDPNAAWGELSGTENSDSLGFEVEAGQDNFIYVRMRNRSNTDSATNATVTVYWGESSTFVPPDLWHPIGETSPVDVPAGDTLVVAGPITWRKADIPATGHYCFIGVINQARDLAPPVPPATDWDGFTAFIRNHNNVTWRNFNVIDVVADPPAQSFMVAGAPDRNRAFDLELLQRLPREANAVLEMPLQLFASLPRNSFLSVEFDRKKRVVRVSLPHLPRLRMANVMLRKGARHRCRLIMTGLKGKKAVGHSVAIRQLYEGQEVGRITWVFRHKSKNKNDDRPPPKKYRRRK